MFDSLILISSWILVVSGCVFMVVGGVGILRMPDLYTRLHASSVTATGGALFLMLGLLLQALFVQGSLMVAIKVVLVLFFTLFTSPTASHALAKTALLSGHIPTDEQGRPILDSPESAQKLARSRVGR